MSANVLVETLHSPSAYTQAQLLLACHIATRISRGRFVLTEPPYAAPAP